MTNDPFLSGVRNTYIKLPKLTAIRVFEAAARNLSFSKAGDELCVTYAAVSHQIKNLETWFGTDLFKRKVRGVELTHAGETLYRKLAPALAEIDEACREVRALDGKEVLTVGCIPSIASRLLVPNLNDFTTTHPELDVRVVYATANQKLLSGGIDVLVTLGTEDSSHVRSNWLISRATKPVCSPSFLNKYSNLTFPGDISIVPLLHDENRDGWRNWFQAAGIKWVGGDNWPVYQDFNLLVTAAIAGHGIALCPVETFKAEIERGDLVVLSDTAINEDAAYYARHREQARPAVSQFVDWCTSIIGMGAK